MCWPFSEADVELRPELVVVRDGFGEVVMVVVLQLEHEILVGLEHEGCAVDGVLGVPAGVVAIDVPLEAALDPAPQRCADHDVPGVGVVPAAFSMCWP